MSNIRRKLKRKKRTEAGPEPLLQKAVSFYNSRNWQAADNVCRKLLRKNPRNHKALNILSVVLTNKPDLAEAEKYIRQAIQLKPDEPVYYSNLGLILKEQENWPESFRAFSKAAALNPGDGETLYNLGTVHQALRDVDKAKEYYRKAITVNPHHVQALCALCNLLSRQEENRQELLDLLDRMKELLSKSGIYNKEQIYFELARVHDKLGNHEKTFDFLVTANKIVRNSFSYDVKAEQELFSSIERTFTQEVLAEKTGCGSEDPSPIFILGMPRSGTTLVEQILASHSQVAAGGELHFLNKIILQSPHLAVPFQPDVIRLPDYQNINAVSCADLNKMSDAYLDATAPIKKGPKHLTDKMPHNFIHVGMLFLLFPNCKVIHCMRHPMDNCLSLYLQNFKVLHPYAYSLKEIGKYYVSYFSLMEHWREVVPGFMHEVRYETLVKKPDETVEELLKFCGLEWEKSCLEFYKLNRFIKTASEGQADRPLYKTSINRWKKYRNYLQPLEEILRTGGVSLNEI